MGNRAALRKRTIDSEKPDIDMSITLKHICLLYMIYDIYMIYINVNIISVNIRCTSSNLMSYIYLKKIQYYKEIIFSFVYNVSSSFYERFIFPIFLLNLSGFSLHFQ